MRVRAIPGLKCKTRSTSLRAGSGAPTVVAWDAFLDTTTKATADPSTLFRMTSSGLEFVLSQVSNARPGAPTVLAWDAFLDTTTKATADPSTSLRMTSCGLGFVLSQVSNATSFGCAQDRLWGTHCSCMGRFSKIQLQGQLQILRLRSG